jgi:hypothetical protein
VAWSYTLHCEGVIPVPSQHSPLVWLVKAGTPTAPPRHTCCAPQPPPLTPPAASTLGAGTQALLGLPAAAAALELHTHQALFLLPALGHRREETGGGLTGAEQGTGHKLGGGSPQGPSPLQLDHILCSQALAAAAAAVGTGLLTLVQAVLWGLLAGSQAPGEVHRAHPLLLPATPTLPASQLLGRVKAAAAAGKRPLGRVCRQWVQVVGGHRAAAVGLQPTQVQAP